MIRRGVRRLLRLPPRDDARLGADVDAEIALHLKLRAEQLVQEGLSPAAARAEALRRFGPPESARRLLWAAARRKESRMRSIQGLRALREDLVHALRSLRREPGVSLVVILMLALGIGASAAAFGVVDRLLLRGPAHVLDSDRMVRLYATTRSPAFGETTTAIFGYVTYAALRDRATSLEGVAAYRVQRRPRLLGAGEDAEDVRVSAATWDLFPLLGVEALVGRFFLEEEDRPPTGERVAVLGHGLWRSRYGADPEVIGRSIELDFGTYTVVGVAPSGFTGPQLERVDVWLPMSADSRPTADWPTTWNARWLHVVGRLGPDVPAERAAAEADAIFRQIYDGYDRVVAEARLFLAPLRYSPSGREPLEMTIARWIFTVTLILLLLACANVASLRLAQGTRREREVAILLALGIGRGRLVRTLMAQSLLLALAGGGAALLLALWGGALLRGLLFPEVAWPGPVVDLRVFLFAFAVMLAAGLLTGLLPAVQSLRRDLTGALRSGAREGGVRRSRPLTALTIGQAAAATVLLVGAGLFVRSLANVRSLPLGFEPDRVLAVEVNRLPLAELDPFNRSALERMQALEAVEDAALAIGTPFESAFRVRLRVPGHDSIPEMPGGGPFINAVTSGYFATVGARLVQGRGFTPADRADSEPVVIVNETMATALWPGEDPLGKCLHHGPGEPPCSRVVGVVEDAKQLDLHQERAMQYFVPFGQERGIGATMLLVRPRGGVHARVPEILAALRELAPPQAHFRIATLQERIDPEVRPWRTGATLFSLFGALALAVAAFGLYGVIAFVVAQRTHEVGVRMALGARSAQVGAMILRQGVALVLAGLAIGVLASLALGRFLEPALFQVSPRDPGVIAAVVALVVAVAVAAALAPALRATRVDPVIALRVD